MKKLRKILILSGHNLKFQIFSKDRVTTNSSPRKKLKKSFLYIKKVQKIYRVNLVRGL